MTLLVIAVVAGGLALLRYVAGLAMLVRYLRRAKVAALPKGPTPPLTLLKPLYGRDPGLKENLVATLRQNYPLFEVLFLHERPDEPALVEAHDAAARVPDVKVRMICGRGPDARNPKVALLLRGASEASFDAIVAADSDVRPDPLYLRDAANGLAEADAVSFAPVLFGMRTLGARLAGLAIDTDAFLTIVLANGGLVTGATIGLRREALQRIGGYGAVADRIADDYALGRALRAAGCSRTLARRPARIHIPGEGWRETVRWVVRWARTVRSAAFGWYVAGLIPACAPLLLLAAAVLTDRTRGALWLLAALTTLRALVAAVVDSRFCWDRSLLRALHLLPLLWVLEPLALLAGLTGNTITWRGRRYRLRKGRATLLER